MTKFIDTRFDLIKERFNQDSIIRKEFAFFGCALILIASTIY